MAMTTDAKQALKETVRFLRARLLADLHDAAGDVDLAVVAAGTQIQVAAHIHLSAGHDRPTAVAPVASDEIGHRQRAAREDIETTCNAEVNLTGRRVAC